MLKKFLLPLILLAAPALLAQPRISIGINIGTPYTYAPPPMYVNYRPPCPGPNYAWVDGYWYPNGARYAWRGGHWAQRPYAGAYWVAPRYNNQRYYGGHWRGNSYGPKAYRGDDDDDDDRRRGRSRSRRYRDD